MKPILVILTVLMLASCATDRTWSKRSKKYRVSKDHVSNFVTSTNKQDYPMDVAVYNRLKAAGNSELVAMVAAYNLSDVKLERQMPNRCHKQYFNFKSCTGNVVNDTLILDFATGTMRKNIGSQKMIRIKAFNGRHEVEIIHARRSKRERVLIDNSVIIEDAPRSILSSTRLKLDKEYYVLGDTIIGELKVEAVFPRRNGDIKEHVSGVFRMILAGGEKINPPLAISSLDD